MAIDPICKMEVDHKTAKWKSEYKRQGVLLLRSQDARPRSTRHPEKYSK